VIGMTPATRSEVDELLEPAWSWPERTMLATRRRRDASAAEPRCHPQIVRTTVQHPYPNSNPSAALTVKA
jgi:hypothetical protein